MIKISKDRLYLGLIVISAFFFRIYKIGAPFLGNFAARTANYAMVATKFLQGAPFFKPTLYLVANGEPSYTFQELPIFVYIVAWFNFLFGVSIEFWSGLLSIIYTSLSIILLYLVVKRYFSRRVALIAAAGFSLSPVILVYGRGFFAEPFIILTMLLSIFSYLKYLENRAKTFYIISLISFSITLLARLQLTWYLFFIIWFIDYSFKQDRPLFNRRIISYLFLGSIGPILWYAYTFYAASIYSNVIYSIHHQINTRAFPSPLLLSYEFYKRVFDYMVRLAFNPFGFLILLYGLSNKLSQRKEFLFYIWTGFVFLTYLIIPQKVLDQIYYFTVAIVPLSVFFAIGLDKLIKKRVLQKVFSKKRWILAMLVALYLLASFRYYINPAFKVPEHDRNTLKIAKAVQEVTDKKDRVILAGGSTALLYYCQRDGMSFSFTQKELNKYLSQRLTDSIDKEDVQEKSEAAKNLISWLTYLIKNEGADYFVCPDTHLDAFEKDKQFYDYMFKNYELVFDDETCMIFKLNKL